MDDTQRRGLVAQTAVLYKLVQLGFEVLFPYDSSLGYDLAYFVTEEHRNFGFFFIRKATWCVYSASPPGCQKLAHIWSLTRICHPVKEEAVRIEDMRAKQNIFPSTVLSLE